LSTLSESTWLLQRNFFVVVCFWFLDIFLRLWLTYYLLIIIFRVHFGIIYYSGPSPSIPLPGETYFS
jgi:hypothetical protein